MVGTLYYLSTTELTRFGDHRILYDIKYNNKNEIKLFKTLNVKCLIRPICNGIVGRYINYKI